MSNKSSVTVGGTSFLNLLFLVFLVLKLTNVITWSWWWVTAPLWLPLAIVVVLEKSGGYGLTNCIPIANTIMQDALDRYTGNSD